MNEEILKEFISIGTESIEDAQAIFLMTTKYLDELKTEKYNPEFATLTEGLMSKIIVISQNFGFENDIIAQMESDLANFISIISTQRNNNPEAVVQYYNKIYSDTMKFFGSVFRTKL